MSKVIAIVGPTAVGKTALSIEIAHALNGEVISGDSMQVYRHLDIGTAKITPAEQDGIPHHLINILDVEQPYSVAEFKRSASQLITQISGRHHLPMIVGGTGFYLQSLTENLNLGTYQSVDYRDQLLELAQREGKQVVWDRLNRLDPTAAAHIPVGNTRRVIRALEVIQMSGQLFSQQPQFSTINDYLLIGLTTDRQVLYQRINQRVDQMVNAGLIEEARWLYDRGGGSLPSGKGIGYHELFPYFAGQCSLEEAITKIKQDSRHYAKRQLTWFRNKMDVHWFDLVSGQDRPKDIKETIQTWLNK